MGRSDDAERAQRIRLYKWCTFGLVGGGLAAAVVYGAAASPGRRLVAAMGTALVAAAPFALGALVGFLFGIPKTLQGASRASATPDRRSASSRRRARAVRAAVLQPNTNLEQISDWLTKILVGVGLTQLSRIPSAVESLAELAASCTGASSDAGGTAVMGAVLVYFSICGFLIGYLVTRLVLTPAIKHVEEPSAEAVDRVANEPLTPTTGRELPEISNEDAAELLSFSIDELETPDQLIAWGRAKFYEEPAAAIHALERALRKAPRDRRAVETLVLASLYDQRPQGFERAIRYAREYLDRFVEGVREPAQVDANLYAYLAAALGQKYAWDKSKHGGRDADVLARRALEAAGAAIELEPAWRDTLRALAYPAPGSDEDDLAALAKDSPELRQLLGGAPA